jgi:hypothetical protein
MCTFDIFKIAVIAMVTIKVKKYFFDPIVMKLHINDAWDV